jgi:hypothetical protein
VSPRPSSIITWKIAPSGTILDSAPRAFSAITADAFGNGQLAVDVQPAWATQGVSVLYPDGGSTAPLTFSGSRYELTGAATFDGARHRFVWNTGSNTWNSSTPDRVDLGVWDGANALWAEGWSESMNVVHFKLLDADHGLLVWQVSRPEEPDLDRLWTRVVRTCDPSAMCGFVDGGTLPFDAGSPLMDAGTPMGDAGVAYNDAGMPHSDAGVPISDAGSSDDAGTTMTAPDGGSEPPPTMAGQGCGCDASAGAPLLALLVIRRRRNTAAG